MLKYQDGSMFGFFFLIRCSIQLFGKSFTAIAALLPSSEGNFKTDTSFIAIAVLTKFS